MRRSVGETKIPLNRTGSLYILYVLYILYLLILRPVTHVVEPFAAYLGHISGWLPPYKRRHRVLLVSFQTLSA